MRRALLSVTDKTGIVDFAKSLVSHGFEILSTGGTAATLQEAKVPVIELAEVTGFPEMLDGRVKTLHPAVHGGLLGDIRRESHRSQLTEARIEPIDLLCVNLYKFESTVSHAHTLDEAIESIDIGGPAMIRSAAKNHANVIVVVDPSDYSEIERSLANGVDSAQRTKWAAKAFRHTAFYDSVISRYLTGLGDDLFPETITTGLRRTLQLRYGENPHQSGSLYVDPLAHGGIARAVQLWGKELSYNNLLDSDAAWELVMDLPSGSCAIIKHGNPCGAAVAPTLGGSYLRARESDPISAFGGIAAFNGPITLEAAQAMTAKGNFLEVVIGSAFDLEAMEVFQARSGWGQDVRLLQAEPATTQRALTIRSIGGGALIQEVDEDPELEWKVVTDRQPDDSEWRALRFQWTIVHHVKSNAIVVGTSDALLGIGAGQMNRVQSVRLALEQAGDRARGAVLASDAFFPFPDSIEVAAAAGIAAIAQPGGSKKDSDVIEAANHHGVSMVFTGTRHFRH